MGNTVVYLIGDNDESNPAHKIGYSGNPVARINHLREETGRDLCILKLSPLLDRFSAKKLEQRLHRKYKNKRTAKYAGTNGGTEWFHLNDNDIADLRNEMYNTFDYIVDTFRDATRYVTSLLR